ncbi:NAD(P)-binding domain-containing protein [Dactylosporangium roseum]|uniref:NAD(P)-binding domain-containing protein n=1 Tax=Dactylosporangium roseum TaxID=47989 RepID=A0ABY5ZA08_9ACTN|nr:NAD(P)-binding domain-containing protein [Dactylosporangium roseum]UWZ38918.1 NAD(P)-binding domain-containing protein [Dactylosporangium roseum]
MSASHPMPTVQVLDEAQVRSALSPAMVLQVTRDALIAHATGAVSQPPPWHLNVTSADGSPHGEVHVKGAHLHGAQHYAVKLATGFYTNRDFGLPVSGGLSIIADAATGHPLAIALDNGYMTDLRTGAAGAVAADALANPDLDRAAIIGSGTQAEHQLRMLLLVRQPRELLVHARNPARAHAFAERMGVMHSWQVKMTDTVEDAVRDAQLVITTTPSHSPLVHGEWIAPGTHITAVGSDTPGKQELDISVLRHATVIAVDDPQQCLRLGELQHAAQAGLADTLPIQTLGQILTAHAPGRRSHTDITIADLTGIGAQDAAVAGLLTATASRHRSQSPEAGRLSPDTVRR